MTTYYKSKCMHHLPPSSWSRLGSVLGGRHPALSAARARESWRLIRVKDSKSWMPDKYMYGACEVSTSMWRLVFQVPTLLKCFVIDRDAWIKLQYCTPYCTAAIIVSWLKETHVKQNVASIFQMVCQNKEWTHPYGEEQGIAESTVSSGSVCITV